ATKEHAAIPSLNQLSMDVTAFGAVTPRKIGLPRKDSMSFPGARYPRLEPLKAASWVKTSKLVKEKQALSDHLEKTRGELSFGVVANIVAQIEKLDKAL